MNNPIEMIQPDAETQARFEKISQGLRKRHAASRRLKTYGIMAIVTAISFLAILLTTIISNGYTACPLYTSDAADEEQSANTSGGSLHPQE